jgi:hypothetical protein
MSRATIALALLLARCALVGSSAAHAEQKKLLQEISQRRKGLLDAAANATRRGSPRDAAAAAAGLGKYSRVFMRRMRKAGSTSIMNFLNAYKNRRAALGAPTVWVFQEEYHALNARCLLTDGAIPGEGARARRRLQKAWKLPLSMPSKLAAANVFRVTHLREPIARHNSEFWFAGPGKDNKKADAASWREWMAATNSHVQSFSFIAFREGLYFDNYYVRMLSATDCGPCAQPLPCRTGNVKYNQTSPPPLDFCPVMCAAKSERAAGRHKMDAGNSRPWTPLGRLTSRDKRVARAVLEVSARARARVSFV